MHLIFGDGKGKKKTKNMANTLHAMIKFTM